MSAAALDAEHLALYLSRRMPEAEGLEVLSLSRNIGGMSRETWFAEVRWHADGAAVERRYTVRADHLDGVPAEIELRYEYDVYRILSGTGLPVPRAEWFEGDPAWIGRPFYLREVIDGSTSPKKIFAPGQEEVRREIGRQLATHLARIHTLDWRAHGLDGLMEVPPSPDACAATELDRWTRHLAEHAVDERPVLTELLSWLRRNAPTGVDRISLVWGDVGLGNFIYSGDRIVGLIDWEFAHLDDPMKDWAAAFSRGVDSLLPREELFEIYERESGIRVDERSIAYHSVFLNAQYAILAQPLLGHITERDGLVDISVLRNALGFPHSSQRDAMATIARLETSIHERERHV